MFGIFCVPFLGSFWQLVHSIVTVGVGRFVLFQFLACLLYSSSSSCCVISQDFRKTAQNWYINTYKIHLKFNTTENFEKSVTILFV